MVGWKWWSKFRMRHSKISLRKAENLSGIGHSEWRRVVFDPTFFDELDFVLTDARVKNNPRLIFNADETGVQVMNYLNKIFILKMGFYALLNLVHTSLSTQKTIID